MSKPTHAEIAATEKLAAAFPRFLTEQGYTDDKGFFVLVWSQNSPEKKIAVGNAEPAILVTQTVDFLIEHLMSHDRLRNIIDAHERVTKPATASKAH